MEHFDCIVIGAGVSGMTAAIYLKRSNLNVLLLEKSAPGGQINRTASIENYPGFQSIDGPTLAMNIYEQVQNLKIDYRYGNVESVREEHNDKIVKTDMGVFKANTVIIATGRTPRELGLENEKPLTGRGVSWCAICDGPLYRDKIVAVVGGGNSAIEEALYLSSICKKVMIIHRRSELRADPILQEHLKNKENVEFYYNCVVSTLNEKDGRLSSIIVDHKGNSEELKVDGLFIYIGFEPDTKFLKELDLKMDEDYIVVDSNMATSLPGIYACGDVVKKEVYQITTAVGEGAIAALSVKKEFER